MRCASPGFRVVTVGRLVDIGAARRERRLRVRPVELLLQAAAVAGQRRPGNPAQQDSLRLRQRLGLEEKHAAGLAAPGAPRTAFEELPDLLAHLVAVARRMLVENHGVGREPLQAPVLVCGQDLPGELEVLRFLDADEDDRQVARDGELPEALLAERVPAQGLAVGPEGGVGEEDPGGEPLEELSLLDGDAEMALGDLRLGVSEGEDAGGDAVVVELLRADARARLVGGHAGGERNAGEAPGRQPQPGPEAQDGVEDRAGRAREGSTVHGHRVVRPAPPSEEPHAVGLPFDLRLRRSLDGEDVERDERRVVRGARPPSRHERRVVGDPRGLDEELAQRGVGDVLGDGAQAQLDVARQLDLARAVAPVGQRDAPYLGVVPRSDSDFETRGDFVVQALEDRLLGQELDQVTLRLLGRGLVGGGPDGSRVDVAQVEELASGVGRTVLSPPGHGSAAAEARAAAAVGDDRDIVAVREDVRPRVGRVGRAQAARSAGERGRLDPGLLGRMRLDRGRRAWNPFLQEELGRLDPGIGVEPVDHHVAQKDVGDGDERHSLVVGEVGLDDDAAATSSSRGVAVLFRLPRRVVDRVEVPERPPESLRRQASQIACGLDRLEESRQGGRVGSHDEVVGQTALQPEPRDAELLVLVVAEPVGQIVGGLGDSPRHLPVSAVPDLLADRHPATLVEQSPGVRPHQEERHQVLEHRRAPRDERRDSGDADDEPSEMEPMALRDVALGDGEEAPEPCLRGQQVVVGHVRSPRPVGVGQAVSDREELAPAVVEEGEIHPFRQGRGAKTHVGQQGRQVRLATQPIARTTGGNLPPG